MTKIARHAKVPAMNIPLWAVSLAIAGLAPFLVGFAADAIDAKVRRRTRRAFDEADEADDEERQS